MKKLVHRHSNSTSSTRSSYRILLCICVAIVFILLSLYLKVFSIQTVKCIHTNNDACSEPVVAELNHLKNDFFFSTNILKTLEKIKRNDPTIQTIRVEKKFPHTVNFFVETTQTILAIQCSETFLSVNAKGDILESRVESLSNIPTLQAQQTICSELSTSKKMRAEQVQEIKDFIEKINTSLPDHQLEWLDFSTLVMKTSSQQRILLLVDQLHYQLQMYFYLKDQQSLPADWQELDLRFQRAIVR